jgi:hypothetical protein
MIPEMIRIHVFARQIYGHTILWYNSHNLTIIANSNIVLIQTINLFL